MRLGWRTVRIGIIPEGRIVDFAMIVEECREHSRSWWLW